MDPKPLNQSSVMLVAGLADLVPDVSVPKLVPSENQFVSNDSAPSVIPPPLPVDPELLLKNNIIPDAGQLGNAKVETLK